MYISQVKLFWIKFFFSFYENIGLNMFILWDNLLKKANPLHVS